MRLQFCHKILAAAFLLLAAAPLRALEQNKVLIRDFKWQVRATEHFDIHYYDK